MKMSPLLQLRVQALCAIVLTILFYILAVGMGLALIALPILEVLDAHRFHLQLAIFGFGGGVALLSGVWPRRNVFEAPGPRITAATQPQFFKELTRVAQATQQRLPDEVYVLPEVNAWVADIGRRRVLAVGLPLLHVLTVTQLRAVLAHEFGHYSGGDTRLGGFLYGARRGIGQAVSELSERRHLLRHPFRWYGNAFLRLTFALSRRQEFEADRMAAEVAGRDALIGGLEQVQRAALVYPQYWHGEAVPVLQEGYRVPLGEGFERFLRTPGVTTWLQTHLSQDVHLGRADPYDTHPPMAERVKAARRLRPRTAPEQDPSASTLVKPDALEEALLGFLVARPREQALQFVSWERVGQDMWGPLWREQLKEMRPHLQALTARTLPALLVKPDEWLALRMKLSKRNVDDNRTLAGAVWMLGMALADAAFQRGLTIEAQPGEAITLRRGEEQVEPFNLVQALVQGKLTAEAFVQATEAVGLADVPLG